MYITEITHESLTAYLTAARPPRDSVICVFAAEDSGEDVPLLIDFFKTRAVSFFGGIFPAVIEGDRHHRRGAVLLALPAAREPVLIEDLSLEKLPGPTDAPAAAGQAATAVVIVDGQAANIDNFLSAVYNSHGDLINCMGGGAAHTSLERKPCVFSAAGIYKDAAVVAFLAAPGIVGARHGWRPLSKPIVATKTDRNIIRQLNWQNALDLYSRLIFEKSGQTVDTGGFYHMAMGYPFGIFRENSEMIVRDPVAIEAGGGVRCCGEVPQNAVLHIMAAGKDELIAAAARAAAEADFAAPGGLRLVFECFSRHIYLGEAFGEELAALRDMAGGEIYGALSFGEIASSGGATLEFYNKTVVVGLIKCTARR